MDKSVVPIERVISDAVLINNLSSKGSAGHGFQLITEYVFNFIRKFVAIFFAAISVYALQTYIKKLIKAKWVKFLLYAGLFIALFLVIIDPQFSISLPVIFLFLLLIVDYYNTRKKQFKLATEYRNIFLGSIFPIIAVVSTLGSNNSIANMLLFYLSLWAVGILFFLSEGNTFLFKKVCYFVVLLAVTRALLTGFLLPHGQRGLLSEFRAFKTDTRGSFMLDKEMYDYIYEIKNYLKDKNLYGSEIIINSLPGLVYLLDSNIPGSIIYSNFDWQVYCASLSYSPPKNPIVIFSGEVPKEFLKCLADHGVNILRDYKLDKTIKRGLGTNSNPTYIYTKTNINY